MTENNVFVSHIYDFKVYKNNAIVDESTLEGILSYLKGILENLLDIVIIGYKVIKCAKQDDEFECNIGVFRAKYRDQAGVEKFVLTTFFEKQNVAMLLGAC